MRAEVPPPLCSFSLPLPLLNDAELFNEPGRRSAEGWRRKVTRGVCPGPQRNRRLCSAELPVLDEGGGAGELRVPCWDEYQTCCFLELILFFLQLQLALVVGQQIAKAAGPERDAILPLRAAAAAARAEARARAAGADGAGAAWCRSCPAPSSSRREVLAAAPGRAAGVLREEPLPLALGTRSASARRCWWANGAVVSGSVLGAS